MLALSVGKLVNTESWPNEKLMSNPNGNWLLVIIKQALAMRKHLPALQYYQ